jgi:ribosomal protein S18 acetylase RimI-like enzyme
MITYLDSAVDIKVSQLQGCFVDWPSPPTPETHLQLLHSSDEIVLALDDQTNAVVGFITAITDYVLSAYIPLLEVLPAYRHQGIGHELARRMVERLNKFYMVDLQCDPKLQPFYEAVGMQTGTAMFIRNYSQQSGT